MDTKKTRRGRSLAEEATTFWLLVTSAIMTFLAVGTTRALGLVYLIPTVSIAALYAGLAYLCWVRKRWAFLLSLVSALVATIFFSQILYSSIGPFLVILQLQIVFFAYRAYEERKTEAI